MKILVIGGSYFLGKHFVRAAAQTHDVYVLNRGTRPLSDSRVTAYRMDRHDAASLSKIAEEHFDVIVDFCAYQAGDIRFLLEHLRASCGQYIYISTCDVYMRNTMQYTDESGAFETRIFGGEAGGYISGKVALEKELATICEERAIACTSFRPAFIYGPDNYAPREAVYFRWIVNAGQIIHPSDATGEFQMVYAADVAAAVLAACHNPLARNKAYNLCNPEMLNYSSFADILAAATNIPFEKAELPVQDILNRGIPLPFPLFREESQYYRGELVQELGISYTPIVTGMAETFSAYMQAHEIHEANF